MKLIKGAIFTGIGLFVVITLISLLMPNKIYTAKSITVQADSLKLFSQISDLNNWKKWHPVFLADSNKIALSNTDNAAPTAIWSGNGNENKLLVTTNKYPVFAFALQRKGENDLVNEISITPVNEGGNMQVQWKAITTLKWYPWEKFSGIFIEKLSGVGYEAALQSLKTYIEKTN
jgi:Polyketide cyclase / dehydrase and lipid transport